VAFVLDARTVNDINAWSSRSSSSFDRALPRHRGSWGAGARGAAGAVPALVRGVSVVLLT
jgi:hypothetical protein